MEPDNRKAMQEYLFYISLGRAYEGKNSNQAYLCYENALHYCKNNEEARQVNRELARLQSKTEISVPKTAIIILSYNNINLTKECIASIKKHNLPASYEIIVVDNASIDDSQVWLKAQQDIKVILNDQNKGFPEGCNQGILMAEKKSDILLLNNDTIVMPNAIFWLRMGLYECGQIGATGSVSNNAVNYQQVSECFATMSEWSTFAEANNAPMDAPYERKAWLVGFAMLIKRQALNKIGLLDTQFFPGNYEDNDLSIRLLLNDYQLLLCKNSFIFHYGGKEFAKNKSKLHALLIQNEVKLTEKYGFNYIPYSEVDLSLLRLLQPQQSRFSILEIGCGLGCTLAKIQSLYPEAELLGIEDHDKLFPLAKLLVPTLKINFITEEAALPPVQFDYIMIDRSLANWDAPKILLSKAKQYLKKNGRILLSVQNVDCIKDIYEGKGKKFSFQQIVCWCNECLLEIKQVSFEPALLSDTEIKASMSLAKARGQEEMAPVYRAKRLIFEII